MCHPNHRYFQSEPSFLAHQLSFFTPVPQNRDGVSTFLVHKQNVFCGKEEWKLKEDRQENELEAIYRFSLAKWIVSFCSFVGTERIIHCFPLMDDVEIRSGRQARAAAVWVTVLYLSSI